MFPGLIELTRAQRAPHLIAWHRLALLAYAENPDGGWRSRSSY